MQLQFDIKRWSPIMQDEYFYDDDIIDDAIGSPQICPLLYSFRNEIRPFSW